MRRVLFCVAITLAAAAGLVAAFLALVRANAFFASALVSASVALATLFGTVALAVGLAAWLLKIAAPLTSRWKRIRSFTLLT